MNIDSAKQYGQNELPSDIFNSSNGDVKNFNGQQVKVSVNNNGTRSLTPLSSQDQAMSMAKAAQQMQIEANQPAISTLNQQKTDLGTQYQSLLDSITASEQPALNSVILATNNELGKRGITGDSSLAQSQIAQAQIPITTQFEQLKANTGLSRQQDLGNLASEIASLQAGNVPGALGYASGITSSQNQLAGVQAQNAAQIQAANIAAANNIAVQRYANQFQKVGQGDSLVNTLNNSAINPSMLTSRGNGAASLAAPRQQLR